MRAVAQRDRLARFYIRQAVNPQGQLQNVANSRFDLTRPELHPTRFSYVHLKEERNTGRRCVNRTPQSATRKKKPPQYALLILMSSLMYFSQLPDCSLMAGNNSQTQHWVCVYPTQKGIRKGRAKLAAGLVLFSRNRPRRH